MQSVAFITSTTSSYKAYFLCTNKSYIFREQFLLHAPMTTYLKDLAQSLGRYGGLLKIRFGFKGFWMHKLYLYLVQNFWLAKMGGKHHMLKDL